MDRFSGLFSFASDKVHCEVVWKLSFIPWHSTHVVSWRSGGMRVILGARDLEKGEAVARSLSRERGTVSSHQLDVTDQQSIDRLVREVSTEFGRLDVLVNNAAILYDT